jgi:hypothetical protein
VLTALARPKWRFLDTTAAEAEPAEAGPRFLYETDKFEHEVPRSDAERLRERSKRTIELASRAYCEKHTIAGVFKNLSGLNEQASNSRASTVCRLSKDHNDATEGAPPGNYRDF